MSGVSRRGVLDDRADRSPMARLEAILGRTLRILICGVATFALTFIELLAEFLAPLLLLAGGTGLAPLMSILEKLASDGCAQPVHLIYGVSREAQDEFGLASQHRVAVRKE